MPQAAGGSQLDDIVVAVSGSSNAAPWLQNASKMHCDRLPKQSSTAVHTHPLLWLPTLSWRRCACGTCRCPDCSPRRCCCAQGQGRGVWTGWSCARAACGAGAGRGGPVPVSCCGGRRECH